MTVRPKHNRRSLRTSPAPERSEKPREGPAAIGPVPRKYKRRLKTQAMRSLPRTFDPTDTELVRLFLRAMLENILKGKISDFTYTYPLTATLRQEVASWCLSNDIVLDEVLAPGASPEERWRMCIPPGSAMWSLYNLKHTREGEKRVTLIAADEAHLHRLVQQSKKMRLRILRESSEDLAITLANTPALPKPGVLMPSSSPAGPASPNEEEMDPSDGEEDEGSALWPDTAQTEAPVPQRSMVSATSCDNQWLQSSASVFVPEPGEASVEGEDARAMAGMDEDREEDWRPARECADPLVEIDRADDRVSSFDGQKKIGQCRQLMVTEVPLRLSWRARLARTLVWMCGPAASTPAGLLCDGLR